MIYNRPKVGMGVLIFKSNLEFLIGKRRDINLYGLPGGHLEKFEDGGMVESSWCYSIGGL